MVDDAYYRDDIREFLGALSATEPNEVLDLLEHRIEYSERAPSGSQYLPIPYGWDENSPLQFRKSRSFVNVIRRVQNGPRFPQKDGTGSSTRRTCSPP